MSPSHLCYGAESEQFKIQRHNGLNIIAISSKIDSEFKSKCSVFLTTNLKLSSTISGSLRSVKDGPFSFS